MADDYYTICKDHTDRIKARYDELTVACDQYLETLGRLIEEEQAKPEPNQALIGRLRGNSATAGEFLDILESVAHDGLIRATDRVIMVKIAAEGKFV